MAKKKPEVDYVFFAHEEMEKRKKAPVLIKVEEIAANSPGENRATLIVDPKLGFNNRIIRMWINKLKPGSEEGVAAWKVLGHRHTVEAIIYIQQGRGYSVVDGHRYDWEPGDLICVPYFAWHRHVNSGDDEMQYVACTTQHLSRALGVAVYEDERYPEYWVFAQKGDDALKTLVPGGSEVPQPTVPPPLEDGSDTFSRLYEEQLYFAAEEENRRRAGKVLVKGKDIRFEKSRMGRIAYLIDPRIGFHVKQIATLMAEIPPGGRSGAHRHLYEEINYILSGTGYSIIEDRRYEWKAGDALSIPMFGWHQHFNTGDKTARFLVHTSRVAMENLGHVLTQQGESCSE
jgi:gentisate 1,2-dioxygenase